MGILGRRSSKTTKSKQNTPATDETTLDKQQNEKEKEQPKVETQQENKQDDKQDDKQSNVVEQKQKVQSLQDFLF